VFGNVRSFQCLRSGRCYRFGKKSRCTNLEENEGYGGVPRKRCLECVCLLEAQRRARTGAIWEPRTVFVRTCQQPTCAGVSAGRRRVHETQASLVRKESDTGRARHNRATFLASSLIRQRTSSNPLLESSPTAIQFGYGS
jgi:hypothetical protein